MLGSGAEQEAGGGSPTCCPNPPDLGLPTVALEVVQPAEHSTGYTHIRVLALPSLQAKPHASLWKSTDTSTWAELRFLAVFSSGLSWGCQGRKTSQERKERQTRGLYNQTLKAEKVQTWMQFSPAGRSQPQWEQAQGVLTHLH